MSRHSLRRTPQLETLEIRQVLSSVVGPTPDQQYALELINLARTNPSAAAVKFTSNITPDVQATLDHFGVTAGGLQNELNSTQAQPPLAWSDALGSSAQSQSQYQADNGVQTHQGSGEAGLGDRVSSAGYKNVSSFGENTYAYADSTDEAMQSFLFDWGVADHGHFKNLLQPGTSAEDSYKDVGVGLVKTNNQGLGPVVVTMDFGGQKDESPQILGVVYDDPNKTGFYTPGKGQAGVAIDAVNLSTGKDYQTSSFGSGGYQVAVDPNADYKVTATENGHVISSRTLHVGDVNAKTDFVHDPANDQDPSTVATPAPAPAPVQAPAPVVSPPQDPSGSQASQVPTVKLALQTLVSVPPQQDQSTSQDPSTTPTPSTPTNPSTPAWLAKWSRWTATKGSAN